MYDFKTFKQNFLSLTTFSRLCSLPTTPSEEDKWQHKIDYVDACCYSERPLSVEEKIKYYDDLVSIGRDDSLHDAALILHLKYRGFVDWLIGNGYIYRDKKGKLRPCPIPMSADLLRYKEGKVLVTVQGRAAILQEIKHGKIDSSLLLGM